MNVSFPPVPEQMDLLRQNAQEIISEEELERKLDKSLATGKPLRVKQGFDPTRPDLHIGHAVSIRQLRVFQELGHEVIFVIGDYTALIGDPTGRSELRPRLTESEIAENSQTYAAQVFQILDAERTTVEYNSRWLKPLKLEDVLKLTAHYTVARMIEREDFANRFREGRPISLVEFMYPLLQAYDSVALRADIELGGSDQKFNLLVARAIQERYGQDPQVCMLMPLLRGTDGVQKMSKSYDNYIGLSMPADDQYGRTMSIPDELLPEWYQLVSGLERLMLQEHMLLAETEPYRAKRALAALIVERHHGAQAATEAADRFDLVHREHGVPDDIPSFDITADDAELGAEGGEVWLPRLLVRAGLAPSTSQAGRLIEQGAVSLDGTRVDDRKARVPLRGEVLLQRGKRHFAKVRFVGQGQD
ncbi:MAG TPA: tyrosine--tRNA ligase [Longimicrobiaceae bacterium]|nr:tyrosine--tRNA ligase [Longimicrobiaceae bacterium]